MADFEKAIEKAVADLEIPGCVLVATNRDGSFKYNKAFGHSSLKEGTNAALNLNSIMWTASCTKLQTCICIAQLVERGLADLDAPVYPQIPELKDFPVIKGFQEDGTPIEEPHKNPITLRSLLQHTSGFAYDFIHPLLQQWLKYHGKKGPSVGSTVLGRFVSPMVFEPGTGWMYGSGIDFAGLFLERLTGKTLEEHMKANLWDPLGIKDATFFPSTRPDLKERMVDMSFRGGDGKLAFGDSSAYSGDGEGNERKECMGGEGVFTSPEEYIKVLHALLVADTDEKILKKETVDEFFRPQLNEAGRNSLQSLLRDTMTNNAMGGVSMGVDKDWGLGGLVITQDTPDGKKAGSMFWGGLPNLIWFLDRKTGLCGLYASQVLPTGDATIAALARKFEAGMYELYGKSKSQKL
ncbi:beta-lactamase/transpeptidase-like protein [Massarina eburnea CBS 473.64]|uniref:Beta-lactamase/transpeptidase-like protein n=1 Tax=Massarina eburnea CBS 473.64 TaxID=1395130 RepID=A0A6A6RV17_9PLEO|nr:beta-lactamase/transpeptidase-like protein [Massarina eburnea CBS 473.64]